MARLDAALPTFIPIMNRKRILKKTATFFYHYYSVKFRLYFEYCESVIRCDLYKKEKRNVGKIL